LSLRIAGYGRFGGARTSAVELTSIFDTLELNELLDPSRLLTGYIPNAEALTSVAQLVTKLRKQRPDIIYMLDRRYFICLEVFKS
jgi:pyridoxine kinase